MKNTSSMLCQLILDDLSVYELLILVYCTFFPYCGETSKLACNRTNGSPVRTRLYVATSREH